MKQGDNALGSVHPSVCVSQLSPVLPVSGLCVSVIIGLMAYANDIADVVDRLLILLKGEKYKK